MRHPRVITLSLLMIVGAASSFDAQQQGSPERRVECASLPGLQLENARITESTAVAAAPTGSLRVAHCRVSGVIDKEIRFTALLPDQWNDRLFAGGGGGYVGSVQN